MVEAHRRLGETSCQSPRMPRWRNCRGEEMTLIDRCSQEGEGAPDDTALAPTAVRGELPLSLPFRHAHNANVNLRYELAGKSGAPLLIVAGGISAGRHVLSTSRFPEPGWWQAQSDTLNQYQVLGIDWIGADGTPDFPIDPVDQAEAIALLLSKLAIQRAAAFIGASYGAMVGMQLAALHPELVGKLIAISAAHQSHPFASASRSLQREALSLGEAGGNPGAGVALARALAILTYRTPEEFAERFSDRPTIAQNRVRVAAQGYLDAHGARHSARMSAAAYRRLSESIDLHQVEPARIRVPLTLVAVDQDHLVPAGDVRALADAVPGSSFHLVQSRYGHDAFLKEDRQVAAILSQFLETLEHAQ